LRRPLSASSHHLVGQFLDALAALGPVLAQDRLAPMRRDKSFIASISASVSETKWLMATTTGTPNFFTFSMWRPRLAQPFFTASTFSLPRSSFLHAAIHLHGADGGDDDGGSRLQARLAALDVEELLGAEIGAETGFGDDIVGQLQRRRGGHHRVAAMGDVGERAAMHEGRVVFQRLHQVRLHRVLEQTVMAPSALRSRHRPATCRGGRRR
jgi:hypothetical protein